MTAAFVLALSLIASPKSGGAAPKAKSPFPPGDIRTFCNEGGAIEAKPAGAGKTFKVLQFPNRKQHIVRLVSGKVLLAQANGELNELLVEENGKYRRIVSGRGTISSFAESPDGKGVAVVATLGEKTSGLRPAQASLYIFNTGDWAGENVLPAFGYSGMAWSPDGKRLAVGDYAHLKVFDAVTFKPVEHCGIDAMGTQDGNEWLSLLA